MSSSNFAKVSRDSFHGVDTKAKIPDGASGKSLSQYATVDGNISIPPGGLAYIVMSGSPTVPVKSWVYSSNGIDANGGAISVLKYLNASTTGTPTVTGGSTQMLMLYNTYKELAWKTAVCEPGSRHFTRSHITSAALIDRFAPGANTLAEEDTQVALGAGDIDESFNDPSSGVDNPSTGDAYYGTCSLVASKVAFNAGGVDTCPKRWRQVSGSLKIQCLTKAEYTAGYWKSVDYFPQKSYQTLGLYLPPGKCETIHIGNVPIGNGSAAVTHNLGDAIRSKANVVGNRTAGALNNKVGLDLKLIEEWAAEEPFYGEKPSYNEGSVESLKAVQFNLQRKAGTTDWCTQGLIHTPNKQRMVTSDEISSKAPVNLGSSTYGNHVQLHPESNAADHIYYEMLPNVPTTTYHNVNHRLYGFGTHTNVEGVVTVGSPAPPCMSVQGLESDAAVKQVLEAQHDLNMSSKVIVIRNTGAAATDFRLTTAAVFEVTVDMDSSEFDHMRPTSKKDGALMRKMQKIGHSASRRVSR